ncbi:hypothetical protein PENTCL1PPCAC_9131, partial [Pristionchus entomophagus]
GQTAARPEESMGTSRMTGERRDRRTENGEGQADTGMSRRNEGQKPAAAAGWSLQHLQLAAELRKIGSVRHRHHHHARPRLSHLSTKSIESGHLPILAVRLPFSIDERRTW